MKICGEVKSFAAVGDSREIVADVLHGLSGLCACARCLVMPEAQVSSAESHLSDAVAMEGRTAVGRLRRFRSARALSTF